MATTMKIAVNLQTTRASASAVRSERRVTSARATGGRDARACTFVSRGADGLKLRSRGPRAQHARGALVTRCDGESVDGAPPMLTCVNDFPASDGENSHL
eukprot:1180889-Prorocentrum_minimum.AAC.3